MFIYNYPSHTTTMQAKTTHRYRFISICSILHFLVDGLCVCSLYLLSSHLSMPHLIAIFLTYNILAFLSQPLTGILADRSHHRHWLLLSSVLFLTIAVLLTSIVINTDMFRSTAGMLAVATTLGIGNSLFHVWGGKQTVLKTANDIRALGVFVSTGAFGLSVGMVFCSWALLFTLLLSICALSLVYLQIEKPTQTEEEVTVTERDSKHSFTLPFIWFSMIALMLIVMLRSMIGEVFSSGIVKSPAIVLLLGAVAMAGKMAGGWMCKYMGIIPAMIVVAIVVVVCLIWRDCAEAILFVGIFTINLTMPVTLYLANILLRGKEGLAFGLLAAALIPGYLLVVL